MENKIYNVTEYGVVANSGELCSAKVQEIIDECHSAGGGTVYFPAGEYVSLQIRIGSGEGKNWWCCLFPPLCLGAASSSTTAEDAFISVGLTPSQYQIITETERPVYRVRFKILELLSSGR